MVRLRTLALSCLLPLLSLSAPTASSSTFALHCNASLHLDCHDSSKPCVPLEWLCDGVHDCPNGFDESHCSYLHECPAHQLMCRDGECVASSFRCDGEMDCSDGSDEKGCLEMEEILEKMAMGGPTQSSLFRSSTPRPFHFISPPSCAHDQFACKDGACIDGVAKCDGIWDCPHGDDEQNCPKDKKAGDACLTDGGNTGIMCADLVACINVNWQCDGTADCDDGSDEAHCEQTKEEEEEEIHAFVDAEIQGQMAKFIESRKSSSSSSSTDSSPSSPHENLPSAEEFLSAMHLDHVLCDIDHFRCKGGKCVNESLACNGHADCPMGDDEGPRCGECSSREENKCSHECINLPTGHKCDCPRGMSLGEDGETCEDVDECLHEGVRCSHYCKNVHNGYECSCSAGYELGKDAHSCHLREKDMDGNILVSIGAEIRSAPLFSPLHSTSGYETVVASNHQGITKHMAIDVNGGRTFAVLEPRSREGALVSIHNGEIRRLRDNVTGMYGMALDWIGGNIVYTARWPNPLPGIYLCKSNGLFCRRIIEGGKIKDQQQHYRGLAVNPLRGLVAWIEICGQDRRIMVANLDGSAARPVVEHKLSFPSGLAFDIIKNDLYFSDVDSMLIEKINLDTGRRSTVVYPVHHPYDLAFFNNLVYWTEWGTESLKVAAVGMEHSTPHTIHSFLHYPFGIALNHSLTQPTLPRASNPCEGAPCPWMCVAVRVDENDETAGLEARCVCPDEYEENADFNSTMKGSMPCKLNKAANVTQLSYVSLESLEVYCKSGEVCGNGGACVEHANVHGRVDKITCKCSKGYGGLWCELPPLPKAEGLSADEEDSNEDSEAQEGESSINVGTILVLLLLLAVIGGLIYWGSRNRDEINEVTRSTLHRVQEARLPERASELIKNTSRNLGMGPSMPSAVPAPPSSSFSARNTEVTTSIPPPPAMYPPLPRSNTQTSIASSTGGSLVNNFSNPSFESATTAAPYSGFEEMNTTEPSYFTIERADGQETFGTNPF